MKIVLITGASRGIGHATALACARHGFGVVATYRSHRAGADALVEQIRGEGGEAAALPPDVGDVASFEGFAHQLPGTLEREWGGHRSTGWSTTPATAASIPSAPSPKRFSMA